MLVKRIDHHVEKTIPIVLFLPIDLIGLFRVLGATRRMQSWANCLEIGGGVDVDN